MGNKNKSKATNQNRKYLATAASLGSNVFKDQNINDSIPVNWDEKSTKAWEYYQQEPIVANVVNSWRVFALGDEIKVACEDEAIEKDANQFIKVNNINRFIKDMILQLLVKGDCIGYFNRNTDGNDIEKISCLNPVSVKLDFDNGELISAFQAKQTDSISSRFLDYSSNSKNTDFSNNEIHLAIDQLLHLKWNAPEFSPRGNSMVLPAFDSIELLRDFRKAERAIAKRWTTPLRFIQVGGQYGNKTIAPDQKMIEDIKKELDSMDIKSGLVVPFYVKAETYGAEGRTLDTEKKVKQLKEDILIALGMSKSLITGDGPNFATASISLQKMIVQLKEIRNAARQILDWIFKEWKELKGYEDKNIAYHFDDLDLYDETDVKKLMLQLYDRGLVSRKTIQVKMGLDPDLEKTVQNNDQLTVGKNLNIQEIVQLVSLEIIKPEEARIMIGLNKTKKSVDLPERNSVDALYKTLYKKTAK